MWLTIAPYVPGSHQLLLNFAKAIGDQKLYKEALEAAEAAIPNFTNTDPLALP